MNFKVFVALCITMLLIWSSLLGFWYLKAEEISKDPCAICAKKMADKVTCTIGGTVPIARYYYPNGSIYEDRPLVVNPNPGINWSFNLNGSG